MTIWFQKEKYECYFCIHTIFLIFRKMKNKTFIALISTAALLANLFIFAAASAADQTPLGNVTVDQGSARTLTSAPSSVTLASSCTTTNTASTCTKADWDEATEGIEWSDLNGSTAAYTITVTTTELSNSATDKEIGHGAITFGAYSIMSTAGYSESCAADEGFTTSVSAAFGDANSNAWGGYGTGTSDPTTVVTAALGHEPMSYCTFTPTTNITVPAFLDPYEYIGTLTFSMS